MMTNFGTVACNYFFYVELLVKNGKGHFNTMLSLHYNILNFIFVHNK